MNKNNTTTPIVAILMIATLVVGGTLASTTAFAYQKKGGGQENSKNGNTVTIQKCKQDGTVSGFDNTAEQECQNTICTHPDDNATCSQEGAAAQPPTPTAEPTTTTLRVIKTVHCLATHPDCSIPPVCGITVTSPSTGPPQDFQCQSAFGNGVLVTLQPGAFLVEIHEEFVGFKITTSGCEGVIAEGQHLTCTITNTEQ
jgi:hypothetical protein